MTDDDAKGITSSGTDDDSSQPKLRRSSSAPTDLRRLQTKLAIAEMRREVAERRARALNALSPLERWSLNT